MLKRLLSTFSVVVAVDQNGGIGKNNTIPWKSDEDMKFFRELTVGNKNNCCIMGRKTYESIPKRFRPLKDRDCIVISNTWEQENYPEVKIVKSLEEALDIKKSYDNVFVIGGEKVYEEALKKYTNLCNKIYVTEFNKSYDCDVFFPYDFVKNNYKLTDDIYISKDFIRRIYKN